VASRTSLYCKQPKLALLFPQTANFAVQRSPKIRWWQFTVNPRHWQLGKWSSEKLFANFAPRIATKTIQIGIRVIAKNPRSENVTLQCKVYIYSIYGCASVRILALKRPIYKRQKGFANLSLSLCSYSMAYLNHHLVTVVTLSF
jgi:hypothetical protein